MSRHVGVRSGRVSSGKAVKVPLGLSRSGSVRPKHGSHGQLRRVKLCSVKAV